MSFWSWVDGLLTDFYLPVILPPPKLLKDRLQYYNNFAERGVVVLASSPVPSAPTEITISNPQEKHEDHDGKPPVSTVFASLGGFVSYVQGEVILRIWGGDYDNLEKAPTGKRPNVIILGGLDPTSVQNAMKPAVADLITPILEESWKEAGGTGTAKDRTALETAFLQRFMSGTASVFVQAGTPLGEASVDPNTSLARLTLRTFFEPLPPQPTVSVPPEDFIDNATTIKRLVKYAGHPLVKAIGSVINVRFRSRFFIWNNEIFDYEPLRNTQVTLLVGASLPEGLDDLIPSLPGPSAITDQFGRIDMPPVPLPGRAMISFRYATTNRQYGNRVYTADVETDAHKARLHVNANFESTRDYKAKFEVYPLYKDFIDDIAEQGDNEVRGQDRGNASMKFDHSGLNIAALEPLFPQALEDVLVPFKQRDLQLEIVAFEAAYKADMIPPKSQTFNVLIEGDSWLNYPLAFNDIWGQLDRIFWSRLKPGIAYNRIPLQHLGDRGDQMFETKAGQTRQWDLTQEFLKEYRIDLILCSAGGNDFAEPGISNDTDLAPYKDHFVDGYFDPAALASMSQADRDFGIGLLEKSFAILLKNHRWNCLSAPTHAQIGESTMTLTLQQRLDALGHDFGPGPQEVQAILQSLAAIYPEIASVINAVTQAPIGDKVAALLEAIGFGYPQINEAIDTLILQPIGDKVIANFPDDVQQGSLEEALLNEVFDPERFQARYDGMHTHWTTLLTKASGLGIPVVTHTYGYPLFDENPASPLGWGKKGLAGPWFIHRFREAKIIDRRIEKICLKALLDRFVNTVLKSLKASPQFSGTFDFVDVRRLNPSCDLWRDEMHLRAAGYRKLAEKIYDRVFIHPKLSGFFQP